MQDPADDPEPAAHAVEVVQQAASVARRGAHLLSARCTLFVPSARGTQLVPLASDDASTDPLPYPLSVGMDSPVAAPFTDGGPRLVRARPGDTPLGVAEVVEPSLRAQRIGTLLCAPIVDGERRVGVIAVARSDDRRTTARDVQLLLELGRSAGHALRALPKRRAAPLLLDGEPTGYHIATALLGSLTTAEVAAAIVDFAVAITGSIGAAAVTWRDREPRVVAERGIGGELARQLRPAREDALTTTPDHPFRSFETRAIGEHLHAVLLPIRVADRLLGACVFASPNPSAIDVRQRHLLRSLARHGGHALDRARLFDAERMVSARLELLATASMRLASSTEWDETVRTIGEILVPNLANACAIDFALGGGDPRILSYPGAAPTPVTVPLVARGRDIGALHLAPHDSELVDRRLLEELAHRCAMALDTAHAQRELQAALRARDEFLAIAGHELKTPITALRMWMFGQERFGAASPVDPAIAKRQLLRLDLLVRQLLDVSRLTSGKMTLERERFDLAELAREVAPIVGDAQLSIHAPAAVVGEWDRFALGQVLVNLLTNAAKYGRESPIELTVEGDERRALIRVRDRGIGVAKEDAARIFERFERAVSTRHFGGFGVGLWICRELVHAHGGTIRVESEPGEGAEFIVELPRRV